MLADLCRRLEEHFTALSREKAARQHSVYAIEHGLLPDEIDTLGQELNHALGYARGLDARHWIGWTVAAAEVGYRYDGDEYWESFAEQFPCWRAFGDRNQIRSWFRRFADRYHGFRPRGRWAEHFTIISWPIGHSILPRYLQAQFAAHLHTLRYELTSAGAENVAIGRLLLSRYTGSSSRFRDLLEQTDLTTHLVLAFRDEDIDGANSPVSRPALQRIVADVESHQLVAARFRETRQILRSARIRPAGSWRDPSRDGAGAQRRHEPRTQYALRLVARQSADGSWKAGVAFPDLSAPLADPGLTASLNKLRIRLVDRPDYWVPGRNLRTYFSDREHAFGKFPSPPSSPVIVSDRDAPELDNVLAQLRISGQPPWLLRIHDDGVARQVLGSHVRAGESYLLLSMDDLPDRTIDQLGLAKLPLRTEDVQLYRFDLPKSVSAPTLSALRELGLGYAVKVKVDPVGLIPRLSGGNDASSWLTTETPLLHLHADFPVSEYTVTLDDTDTLRIPADSGSGTIVALSDMPIGRHRVSVTARSSALSQGSDLLQAEAIDLHVRQPRPWMEDAARTAGFRIDLDPPGTDLDRVLNGKASISVGGPRGRTAHVQLRLTDTRGRTGDPIDIGDLHLPADPAAVRRVIARLQRDPLAEQLQSAAQVRIRFTVGELGAGVLDFAHRIEPVRWKLERRAADALLRLVDEAGSEHPITIDSYAIVLPDKKESVAPEACLTGLPVKAPGGLFVARLAEGVFPVIACVANAERLTSFAALAAPISFASEAAPGRVLNLIARHRIWRAARTLGPLANVRKAEVLAAIENRIAEILCGADWATRLKQCRAGRRDLIEKLKQDIGGSPGFGARCRSVDEPTMSTFAKGRVRFISWASTYGISSDKTLATLAYDVAFKPATIRYDQPGTGARHFRQLAENKHLVRGAYLAKLAFDLVVADALEKERAA